MKRKLSLLLAVVMILSSFSFVFADEDFNVPAFLKKNGILVGNDDGDLMLDENLLRKDSVVLFARLLGKEAEAESFEMEGYPTFTDLAGNPYYDAFLAWAEYNEYFVGRPDGSFGYNDNLEAVESAIVLLRALGYTEEAADWNNAWETAKKLGLLKDIEVERRDLILREDVAQMIFNALSVTIKGSDQTLADKLGIKMPEPDVLEVVDVYAENLKEVIVELSNAKLADEEKLENTNNYRLSGNEIERVEVRDNNVLVQVKNPFKDGKQYELQIKGVDKDVDGKYKFVAEDNTIPAVEKVEVLGEYGIKVVTTEPISNIRSNNFLIDGKNVTMDVEQYGRTIILTPYNGSFPSDAETLTIRELRDFAGFRSVEEDFEIEIVKDEVAPEVVDVVLKGNTVEVVFDKDIYNASVGAYWNRSDVGNISYELGRHTIYANKAKKVDVNKVVYEFKENEVPSRRDEVTIEGVTNHSKVKMEKTTIALREVLDDVEPEIVEIKMTAKNTDNRTATLKLYFDKDVTGVFKNNSDHEFDVDAHFTLYEDEVGKRYVSDEGYVASAKYDYDSEKEEYIKDVIVVELADLEVYDRVENDLEYILEIEGFTNTTSSRYKMFRDYYEFKFTKATDFVVSDAYISYRGTRDTEITIVFNKYLDRELAEDATNYVFYYEKDGRKVASDDVADLDGIAELIGNGTRVVLTIPVGTEDLMKDYDGLRILDTIKDTGGNRLNKVYYFDLASEKLIDEDEVIEEVQTFDEAVAAVTAVLKEFKATNETTQSDLETAIKDAIKNDNITVTLDTFVLTPAAIGAEGSITGSVTLTLVEDGTTITKTINVQITIPALDQDLDDAESKVNALVGTGGSLPVTNETTEEDILAEIMKVITNKEIEVKIFNFNKVEAGAGSAGSITGTVQLTLGSKLKSVQIDLTIEAL